MARAIVLPLYDHTPDDEIAEILETLQGVGLDGAIVVSGYILPEHRAELGADEELVPVPGKAGLRRDRRGAEWYSADWLGDGRDDRMVPLGLRIEPRA